MHADSIHFSDSLKFKTLRKQRTVYGGGGIMPDYFVPLDTTVYTRFYRQLSLKNIILNKYLHYSDQHRGELRAKYRDFEKFKKDYDVPQSLIDEILSEGEKANVKPKDDAELQKTLPKLRLTLKALTARDLWDMSEYFSIMNEESPTVRKALELLSGNKD